MSEQEEYTEEEESSPKKSCCCCSRFCAGLIIFTVVVLLATFIAIVIIAAGNKKDEDNGRKSTGSYPSGLTSSSGVRAGRTHQEWKTRIIYQIITDRFARSDNANASCDLKQYDYCGGSYRGIINKLDYIQNLGFNAIYISNIIENTPRGFHGYWPQNFYKLNTNFGSEADFNELVSECHKRDIWVMVDTVFNHVGDVDTNYSRITPFNQPYHYHSKCQINDYENEYERLNCRFSNLPDLNQDNEYVRKELIYWADWLIQKYNLDGIRIDTIRHVKADFWKDLQSSIPDVYMLGEFFDGRVDLMKPYLDAMPGMFDYPMFFTLQDVYAYKQTPKNIKYRLEEYKSKNVDYSLLSAIIDNHDNKRWLARNPDWMSLKNALAFSMLSTAIPCVYYGTEQGFTGGDDPYNREAMWWSGFNTSHILYQFIQKLTQARKMIPIDSEHIERYVDDQFYAFSRGDVLVCTTTIGSNNGNVVRNVTYLPFYVGAQLVELISGATTTYYGNGLQVELNNGDPQVWVIASALGAPASDVVDDSSSDDSSGDDQPTPTPTGRAGHSHQEWKTRIIYQIITDRFAVSDDSTPSCDLTQYDYCGGSYRGIINKLDYIQNLGFNAIWISNIIENTPRGFHGYWPQNFYKLNTNFGSEADFNELVSECHKRDIWVMVDTVFNHVGDVDTAYSKITPFNKEEHYHSKCQINDYENEYERLNCRFSNLPDLNQDNEYVRKELIYWADWLIQKYNLDGIRIDTIRHVKADFWKDLQSNISDVYMLGEFFDGRVDLMKPYLDAMPGMFDYPMFFTLQDVYAYGQSPRQIRYRLDEYKSKNVDYSLLSAIIDNHDNKRWLARNGDWASLKNALAFSMLSTAIPCVYYGTEQGFYGGDDPYNREAMWWSYYDQHHELYKFIQTLTYARKMIYVHAEHIERYVDDQFYAFSRDKVLVCTTNQGSYNGYFSRCVTYLPFNVGDKVKELFTGQTAWISSTAGLVVNMYAGQPQIWVPA